jgi:DNA-binding NarL/FixJ family response regulator
MPVLNGVETVKILKRTSNSRILMLTISKRQEDLIQAIRAGADGYILKNTDPKDLYDAIELVVRGKSVLSPEITDLVMEAVRGSPRIALSSHNITPREFEVLILLSEGKTNPQISDALHISINTVKTHIRNLMEKLNSSTRTETVTIAINEGILTGSKNNP